MDTCLGKTQQFDAVVRNKSYVQIIHAGSLHWVCVANTLITKNGNGTHYLYDSLSRSEILTDIVKQVASYSCHPEPVITLVTKAVQQQKNGVDCGLFATAFATKRAFGGDPATIAYDTLFLRQHLVKCLENNTMEEFPSIKKRISRCKNFSSIFTLCWTCCMPYWKSKETGLMVAECEQCEQWFYRKCEKIPAPVFDSGKSWVCFKCK